MVWLLSQTSSGQSGSISGATLDGAIAGSEMLIGLFKDDWTQMTNGTSPVYNAVVEVSMLVAVVLVSLWSLRWFQMFQSSGFSSDVLAEMAMPFVVILLLINHGALLAQGTVGLNNTTMYLNRQVLSITRNGVTLLEAIRTVNIDQTVSFATQAALADCQKLDEKDVDTNGNEYNPRQDCIDRTISAAQSEAEKIKKERGITSTKVNKKQTDFGSDLINSVLQGVIFFIFNGLTAGFQYMIQLSFILVAYVAPIFLVLSLLPVGTKAIYAWLSGWLGLTLVSVSYSIVVGISASSIINSPSTDAVMSQIIVAVLAPILALAIGTGTGMAVFSSFGSAMRFAASLAGIRG